MGPQEKGPVLFEPGEIFFGEFSFKPGFKGADLFFSSSLKKDKPGEGRDDGPGIGVKPPARVKDPDSKDNGVNESNNGPHELLLRSRLSGLGVS